MDAVCLHVQHSNPTYSSSLPHFLSSPLSLSLHRSSSVSLSISLKHIFLVAPSLSHKHASTYRWKKYYGEGGWGGNEMHE